MNQQTRFPVGDEFVYRPDIRTHKRASADRGLQHDDRKALGLAAQADDVEAWKDCRHVIARSETSPKPADLADGISQALVTTFLGLLVAIPMTVLFVIFRNKIVSIILEVGSLTEELMGRFKVREG